MEPDLQHEHHHEEEYVTRKHWDTYVRRSIFGYAFLTFGVMIGLLFSSLTLKHNIQDRRERSVMVNRYFTDLCAENGKRDAILIQALDDAITRAKSSIPDPIVQGQAVARLESQVRGLKEIGENCVANIPPVVK